MIDDIGTLNEKDAHISWYSSSHSALVITLCDSEDIRPSVYLVAFSVSSLSFRNRIWKIEGASLERIDSERFCYRDNCITFVCEEIEITDNPPLPNPPTKRA